MALAPYTDMSPLPEVAVATTRVLRVGGVIMRIAMVAAVACLILVGLSAADEAGASIRKPTSIAAQSLGSALKTLAQLRHFQIVYREDVLGARRTTGISGNFTQDEALAELLSGSGLTYAYLDSQTVTIVPVRDGEDASGPSGAPANPSEDEPTPAGTGTSSTAQIRQRSPRVAQVGQETASGPVSLDRPLTENREPQSTHVHKPVTSRACPVLRLSSTSGRGRWIIPLPGVGEGFGVRGHGMRCHISQTP